MIPLLGRIRRRQYRHLGELRIPLFDKTLVMSLDDPHSRRYFLPRLGDGGLHEPALTLMLWHALKDARCFVDAGANLGWFTCVAGLSMPEGRIMAFEMDEDNAELCSRNVEKNGLGNVELERKALWHQSETVHYRKRSKYGPFFSIEPSRSGNATAEAVALDEYWAAGLRPDVVKIDVEGAASQVLRGMTSILTDCRPVLFLETHSRSRTPGRWSSETEALGVLHHHGYAPRVIERKPGGYVYHAAYSG